MHVPQQRGGAHSMSNVAAFGPDARPSGYTTRTIRSARPAVDSMSSALRWSVPSAHALASSGLLPKAWCRNTNRC